MRCNLLAMHFFSVKHIAERMGIDGSVSMCWRVLAWLPGCAGWAVTPTRLARTAILCVSQQSRFLEFYSQKGWGRFFQGSEIFPRKNETKFSIIRLQPNNSEIFRDFPTKIFPTKLNCRVLTRQFGDFSRFSHEKTKRNSELLVCRLITRRFFEIFPRKIFLTKLNC